jgi:hypothetical protein
MHRNELSDPVIRLRGGQLRRHAGRIGLDSDRAVAERLGVSHTTVMRALSGDIAPGERLIAATLAAFPDLRFEDLFEVVEGKSAASGSAA